MTKNRVLITGGTGLLGHTLVDYFRDYYKVYATYLNKYIQLKGCNLIKLDLRDKTKVIKIAKEIKPKLIIHTAALTDVDYCEQHPKEAYDSNVNATINIISACKEAGCDLIHISSNYLFDGKKGNYKEDDKPNPINIYSKTKYTAEKLVINSKIRYIIIRSAIYGWNIQDKKCFPETVIFNLANNVKVKAYIDQFSTPILVNHLSRLIKLLYSIGAVGIFHVGCDEKFSRYEFAIKIAEAFSLDKGLIVPIKTAEIKQLAKRPKDSSLDNTKIKLFLNIKNIPIEKDIKEMKVISLTR